ncbi:DUF3558 domain-containing protein [Nocardiopsis sediminis]|uniref:DUF3558 domain-containing protein n=1 Tax=Nocardiopsis sediminis TaxID=1778267 RepID=A0ABV8FK11_9ACTN
MSDNGPYTQPPQYPDGDNSGGQPPYGGAGQYQSGPYQAPYGGDPNTGGQPGYPPGYGPGQQPGPGAPQFQQPQDQQMFSGGGQPPYGPGPGVPPGGGYPPPKKSSAGLWILIGGAAVIVVLVIAVVVVLVRSPGDTPAPQAEQSAPAEEAPAEEQPAQEEEAPAEGQSGPPYALPDDACVTISEAKLEEYGLTDGSKSLTDNASSCNWYVEGEGDAYGSVTLEYATPYGGADSVEGAQDDFQYNLDYATDESGDYTEREVHEDVEVALGDEAHLVFATEVILNTNDSVSTMIIRKENINVEIRYSLAPGLSADEDTPAPLEFSDVEGMMNDLGAEALTPLGG